jgi:rfaE bifunctional protein nucleotidyltransferase chain/domain
MNLDDIETNYGYNEARAIDRTGKFRSKDELYRISRKYRTNTLIQVSGIFDILHGGHIAYITEASTYGDLLLVSINSDESASRYKGEERPYLNLFHRLYSIASLGVVDYVTVFDEDDPSETIELAQPDIYVKGHDFLIHKDVPEFPVVFKHSSFKLTSDENPEFHTSELVEKIRNG